MRAKYYISFGGNIPSDYGALYNWYAATDARNICSAGWHIATETEWEDLAIYLGGRDGVQPHLRVIGTTYWDAEQGSDNSTGFSAKGSGQRTYNSGVFESIKHRARFWTSTEIIPGYAYEEMLWDTNDDLSMSGTSEKSGKSLRPLKDSTTLTHGQTGIYTGNDGKVYRTICIGTQEWLSQNLEETLYRDNSPISYITDNTAWAGLTTGAYCFYNNIIPAISQYYIQFYPSNEPVLKLEQEAGEIFKRWKIDRFRITRTKNASVYCTLMNMFFDSLSYGTEISYRIDINDVPKYYFKDLIRAGTLNAQNEVYECTPDPDDSYEPILRQYTRKWDNTDGKLFLFDQSIYYPKSVTDTFLNIDFDSFGDTLQSVNYIHSGTVPGREYARSDIANPHIGATVVIVIRNLIYTGDEPWMQLVTTGLVSCSNQVYVTGDGKYELTMTALTGTAVLLEMSVLNLTGSSKHGSFDYDLYLPEAQSTGGGTKVRSLIDRILNHASYFALSPVCSVVSTILWNDPLGNDPPVSIATYMTANPNNDYVIEDPAIWNYLDIHRVDMFTTNQTDNIELCLRDIMDILKKLRFYWFIDEDGKFRIEHDKYFRSYDPQTDLTSNVYAKYQPEVDHFIFTYEGEQYNQINLIEENIKNEDWTPGMKINYDPLITSSQIKDERNQVTTDFKNIIDNPSSVSNSGLILLRLNASDNLLMDASLITSGVYYVNQKLSPAWLSRYYMDYFAEAPSGTLVTGLHPFVHIKETVKQSGVKFFWNADLDWKKPFTMSLGVGWLSAAEYFPETGWYSIDVLYSPYEFRLPSGGGSMAADSTLITVDSTLITVDG